MTGIEEQKGGWRADTEQSGCRMDAGIGPWFLENTLRVYAYMLWIIQEMYVGADRALV